MILQGILRIDYNNNSFWLVVKIVKKEGVYYFFISDKEPGNPLLNGKTLELTFIDSFENTEWDKLEKDPKIPSELIKAIQNMLLKNFQLWYYSKTGSNFHL